MRMVSRLTCRAPKDTDQNNLVTLGRRGACPTRREERAPTGTETILLVEDESAVRDFVGTGLRVVFISGYGASNVHEHGIDTSRDVLLEKPFGPDALLRTVRGALDAASDLRSTRASAR